MYIVTNILLWLTNKRQTRPFVREGAPYWQDSNLQTNNKYLVMTVSRKVTLTLAESQSQLRFYTSNNSSQRAAVRPDKLSSCLTPPAIGTVRHQEPSHESASSLPHITHDQLQFGPTSSATSSRSLTALYRVMIHYHRGYAAEVKVVP
jgi:hypothetical protein